MKLINWLIGFVYLFVMQKIPSGLSEFSTTYDFFFYCQLFWQQLVKEIDPKT